MAQQFDITYAQRRVGQVTVTKDGLYYCFQGAAERVTDEVCRLWVCAGDRKISLGIMIPGEGAYVLKTKLPVNHFEGDDFSFELKENNQSQNESWIPICDDRPFLQLSELKKARLQIRDRQPGAIWD